ncbi:hypothetical protein DSO57_1024414 [Entomophthora muscae]|uniref:Uncharacterized protein n=2 Tax=Entomophthora muscae TaxID=34485 RepID=A0ACC2T3B2_9FUNG|nr:hypothetical protein DSO57_1022555 [Entomophthora muscae]KAJ9080489.1 hypothetical protein DSO57_1024414 [Entomophthora muscae]
MRSTSSADAINQLNLDLERLHITQSSTSNSLLPVVPGTPEMVIPEYVYRRRNGVPNIQPPKLTSLSTH